MVRADALRKTDYGQYLAALIEDTEIPGRPTAETLPAPGRILPGRERSAMPAATAAPASASEETASATTPAKRTLLTGASGLIGNALLHDHEAKEKFLPASRRNGFDLLDEASFFRSVELVAESCDSLLHLAAFTDVSAAHRQRGERDRECYRLNVDATRLVVRACREFGLRLIHVSTDFVFDGKKEGPLTEADTPNPIEWYGETKWIAEELVRAEADHWTILRIAYPIFRERGVRPDLLTTLGEKLAAGNELTLFDDQIITPTPIPTLVAALLGFSQQSPSGETFHVCGNDPLSPWELGMLLAESDNHDESLINSSSLREYLKQDPRPRQRRLELSNAKYRAHAPTRPRAQPQLVRTAGSRRLSRSRHPGEPLPRRCAEGDPVLRLTGVREAAPGTPGDRFVISA